MAQHDYDIANQSGANFRSDLNNALDAIVSNNSGSSAPSTTFAYEWWIDTSNNLLKLRNSANNAWITLPLSITADNATSGGLTVNGNLATTGTVDINGQELILDADADTSITADTDDQIDFKIGGTDVATLTNSHLVLKGTTPKITIGDGGEEDTAIIFDGNAQDFYIGSDDSADDLVIGRGSTVGTNVDIALNGSGYVGINNDAPEYNLDVSGASGTMSRLASGGSSTYLALKNSSNTGFIGINGSALEFFYSGTRAGQWDADGIKFNNDTAAANGLDDYEEGLHTVSMTDSGGGATITLNTSYNQISYTKIGRIVQVSGVLLPSAVSGSFTGTTVISLPFAAADLSDSAGKGFINVETYSVDFTSGTAPAGHVGEGTAAASILVSADNAAYGQARVSTSSQIYVGGTYITDA
jgi:hypothetical protein